MTVWEAILLGIIQGIFMFFPVSSTSHLVLTQHWLISRGSELPPPDSPEMILFDLVVHVGTLISMAVVFRTSLRRFTGHLATGVRTRFAAAEREMERLYLRLAAYGMLSVVATAAIGLSWAAPAASEDILLAAGFKAY